LGWTFAQLGDDAVADCIVYTGPIDEFFGYRFGKLPYRSLKFRHETLDKEWLQPVAVVNYPDESVPYTRITEYKPCTGQTAKQTSITYEFPSSTGDSYYPIPRPENQALFKRYEALARETRDVVFAGRLGTYRYYNMDQVVGQALSIWRKMQARSSRNSGNQPRDRHAQQQCNAEFVADMVMQSGARLKTCYPERGEHQRHPQATTAIAPAFATRGRSSRARPEVSGRRWCAVFAMEAREWCLPIVLKKMRRRIAASLSRGRCEFSRAEVRCQR